MRIPRVYVDCALHAGLALNLSRTATRHLQQVLRLRTGNTVLLFNGDGRDYPGVISATSRSSVTVKLAQPGVPEHPQPLKVYLGVGISRGERMDFTLQKSVELGVHSVTPLFTERSVVRLSGERLAKREAHWQGIVVSACEQSGRRRLPTLCRSASLAGWLAARHPNPVLLDPEGSQPLSELTPHGDAVTFLIGPEGGLSQGELRSAVHAGFSRVRLGPRILRAETAPLAALAIAQSLWGDLRL